ncbi:MAG: Maf family protein [Balneolaceae bacterium]
MSELHIKSTTRNLILASSSPRRSKLLDQAGLVYTIDPSSADEQLPNGLSPWKSAEVIAGRKATEVAERHPESLVLAADTIVVLDQNILGKPNNHSEAAGMLRSLSGRSHEVCTGVAMFWTDDLYRVTKKILFHERTKVTFASLSDEEIWHYIETGSPMDKAGSYGIQEDYGSLFVRRIEGDYFNVVGLPLNKLYQMIKSTYPHLLLRQV